MMICPLHLPKKIFWKSFTTNFSRSILFLLIFGQEDLTASQNLTLTHQKWVVLRWPENVCAWLLHHTVETPIMTHEC